MNVDYEEGQIEGVVGELPGKDALNSLWVRCNLRVYKLIQRED